MAITRTMNVKVIRTWATSNSAFPVMIRAIAGDGPEGIVLPWPDKTTVPQIGTTMKVSINIP